MATAIGRPTHEVVEKGAIDEAMSRLSRETHMQNGGQVYEWAQNQWFNQSSASREFKDRKVFAQKVREAWESTRQSKSLNDFFRCVKGSKSLNQQEQTTAKDRIEKVYGSGYQSTVQKTAMGESSGSVGGYIVPLEWSLQIIDTIAEDSIIYPRAQVVPMGSKTMLLPKVNVESVQTAGNSPFFGGVYFTWGSEQAPTESAEPTYGQIELEAWDLLGYCVMSNQFLADTGPAGEYAIVRLMGKAAAWYSEYAFFQGIGAANLMPMGIINAPGTLSVSRNTATDVKAVDVAGMAAKLIPYSWRNAVWVGSPSILAKLMAVSTFTLNRPDHEGPAGSLLGRPFFISEKLPALGTAGDLMLIDPSLYVIGNRQEVVVDVSSDNMFRTNQTVFRVWIRLGGKPYNSKYITLADATTTASPFVILL